MHDDTAPATKGDVWALEKRMNARFERVHEDIGRVLDVLINLEKRIGGRLEDHEQRIAHLEATVS